MSTVNYLVYGKFSLHCPELLVVVLMGGSVKKIIKTSLSENVVLQSLKNNLNLCIKSGSNGISLAFEQKQYIRPITLASATTVKCSFLCGDSDYGY